MALYEHIFLARADVSRKQVDDMTQRFSALITEGKGRIAKTEYWGLRPLAYVIGKNTKAHYTLLNIEADPAALQEMERQMRLNDEVVRFLSIAVDEHESGPSAAMRSKERDSDSRHAPQSSGAAGAGGASRPPQIDGDDEPPPPSHPDESPSSENPAPRDPAPQGERT